jgi:nucleoside-diphosphate-sugar epimerase
MTVAITGARGFTGRYVCAELDRRGILWYSIDADLTDPSEVEAEIAAGPTLDALIHLAAVAFVGSSNWRRFYEVNQIGTYNLLDSVSRHRPGLRCVVASSAQVYGSAASGIVDESYVCSPTNHYGLSKYAMELGARNWSDEIEIIITRPFNYTGIGQEERYLVPKLVDHFKRRCRMVELGNVSVQRDFGDVREVAAIYCDLAYNTQTIDVINVGSGQLYTVLDIMAMLTKITGHEVDIEINPSYLRPNEVEILGCSVEKLKSTLPNRKYPEFVETLKWMLDFSL